MTRTCSNDCERSPPTPCSDNRNPFHCFNRNFGSVPSASRLMFPRCANMISIAPATAATSNGCRLLIGLMKIISITTNRGIIAAATIDPNDTYLVIRTTTTNMIAATTKRSARASGTRRLLLPRPCRRETSTTPEKYVRRSLRSLPQQSASRWMVHLHR